MSRVQTNTTATLDAVLAAKADAVIVATGSLPNLTRYSVATVPGVADVVDILSGKVAGTKVLIVDRLGFLKPPASPVSGGTGL